MDCQCTGNPANCSCARKTKMRSNHSLPRSSVRYPCKSTSHFEALEASSGWQVIVRTCRYKCLSLQTESITQPSHQAKLGNKVDVMNRRSDFRRQLGSE